MNTDQNPQPETIPTTDEVIIPEVPPIEPAPKSSAKRSMAMVAAVVIALVIMIALIVYFFGASAKVR